MMQSSIHFPPFRQGRSIRQTEAVGTGGAPPVSPHPSKAHPPPSSHASARLHPCASPAPRGTQRAQRVHSWQAPLGWEGEGGEFYSSCARGRGCTGSAPLAGGTRLSPRAEGKGDRRARVQQTHW